jgi:Na+/H+ antiporter NhaD/arsenite permease-like protein
LGDILAPPPTSRRVEAHRWLSLGTVAGVVALAVAAALAAWLAPGSPARQGASELAALVVFVASYAALAVGRVPFLAIDRAGVALVGACLMVLSGALPLDEAYRAVDLETLTLLLGMMIVVANLRLSGFFAVVTAWAMRRAHAPLVLLAAVTLVSGVFSAFLVNDAICLVLAPLVLELTLALGRRPLPYLLAVAMASNVGSVATITGNPQNIMIGAFSRVSYVDFAAALTPVAAAGLVLTVALIAVAHRSEFFGARAHIVAEAPRVRANRVLIVRSLAATAAMVALFFAGQPPAKAAIVVGGLLLLTRRVRSARVYAEIDWSLLLMFAGLFIIVAGAERALLTPSVLTAAGALHLERLPMLAGVTAVLSNVVSNVPAVLVLKPFVDALPDAPRAWLTVAMAATLAGNFTILGSVANLIVVQRAAARGVTVGFGAYFVVGAPLTVLSILFGTWWLMR